MIVSRQFSDAMRGVGRNGLDLPVAALAAFAALFAAFTLPADLLSGMIGATGLPSVLPAAEPPLGMTARIALGVTGAAATFGLVFYLLRVLDRSMLAAPKPGAENLEQEAPRLRRRDFHPDAPAPRPICAAREFGEPAPPVRPRDTAPSWLAEPVSQPEPAPEPQPEPEPAPQPVVEANASLPELMERLERGLARRQSRPAAPAPQTLPQVFPEPGDHRLQSAIESLQRLAARQS